MALCCKCKEANSEGGYGRILRCTTNNKGQHHSFDDEPSYVWNYPDGMTGRRWEVNGVIHRANKRPSVTHSSGYKGWHFYGKSLKNTGGKK